MTSPGEAARGIVRRLPEPVRDRMRAARKRYRSARYRARERIHPVRIGAAEIESALRDAGAGRGEALFVQARLSAFGTIEGGPQTVIDALQAVVGESGLICMPTFSMDRLGIEYLRHDPLFDVRSTPSTMGALSERFRASPGVLRSLHPTHSVCAWGAGAEELIAGHERAETPVGRGSPFEKLVRRGALQVFLGTGLHPLTIYHVFEALREPPFPYPALLPEPIEARCVDADGRRLEIATLVHNPAMAPGRIDVNRETEQAFRRRMIAAGMRAVPLGRSEVLAQPMPEMIAEFERMLGEGVTMYRPEALEEAS